MRKSIKTCTLILLITGFMITTATSQQDMASANSANIKTEEVTYTSGGVTLKGYVAWDASKKGKRPAIIVVPEWWGLNEYPKMRARMLAELGYIAIAADMYGDGKVAATPSEAQELSGGLYKDPQMAKARLEAAEEKLKSYEEADKNNVAAIGYCFGGSMVLNGAKSGMDFKGVVSFHGGLAGAPPQKGVITSKILICHGGADKFVSMQELSNFEKEMDSVGATYTVKIYPGATHAFTNPASTENGKKFNMPIEYNEAADKKSWNEMQAFFNKVFEMKKS